MITKIVIEPARIITWYKGQEKPTILKLHYAMPWYQVNALANEKEKENPGIPVWVANDGCESYHCSKYDGNYSREELNIP